MIQNSAVSLNIHWILKKVINVRVNVTMLIQYSNFNFSHNNIMNLQQYLKSLAGYELVWFANRSVEKPSRCKRIETQ